MSKPEHPYKAMESHPAWTVLDRGVRALVKNGDLEERTGREYVVGYLAKLLADADVLRDATVPRRVDGRSPAAAPPKPPRRGHADKGTAAA